MTEIEAAGSRVLPWPPEAAPPAFAARNKSEMKETRVLGVLGQLDFPKKMGEGAGNPMVGAEPR